MINTIFNTFLAFYTFKNVLFSFTMENVYNDHLIKTKDIFLLACPMISIFSSVIFNLLDKHFITNIKAFTFPFSKNL